MIQKYDRHSSTVIGGSSSKVPKQILKMDPNIATFFGTMDTLVLIFGYFLNLLPYIHFEREMAALPYMTRDFIKMKYAEREQATSFGGKAYLTIYIYLIQIVNVSFNPALLHL